MKQTMQNRRLSKGIVMRTLTKCGFAVFVSFLCVIAPHAAMADEDPGSFKPLEFETLIDNIEENGDASNDLKVPLMWAVADKLGARSGRSATRYLALAEASRTDKQVGAASGTPGATSLVEKAGFPYLLSLALEHGAIEQEKTATALTLSTTPYMFLFVGDRDTPENFQKYDWLRRLGFSTSFAADKGGESTFNDLKTEDISEYSVRLRLMGERSTRSEQFSHCWEHPDAPDCPEWTGTSPAEIQRAQAQVLANQINACRLSAESDRWIEELNALKGLPREEIRAKAAAILDRAADELIANPAKTECIQTVEAAMAQAAQLGMEFVNSAKKFTEAFMASEELLTLTVTQHPIDDGTDFTDIKLVYDQHLLNADLTANAEIALNSDPGDGANAGAEQDTVRDYGGSAALSWELPWKPFVFAGSDSNPRPMLLTAGGKFSYSEEIDDPIGSAQLKLEIPVVAGLTVPIAVTYASRTETDSDDQFVFNIGTGFDLDSIMALLRAE